MAKKSWFKTGIIGAVAAIGVVAASAQSASAYIVCNRFHECWHTHVRLAYPREAGLFYHSDGWRARGEWRWVADRDDRGYWRQGVWIRF